ncbi:uncharacterized protein LOC130015527 [Mercurialis annua]|uniref:uncharacterized protein LOC130015527 n=1 Tax=Mercurialis annua TaxID=3986 RepID=UPI0024AD78F5|nr:uncharacterized protein LOC130015527 [Mercurialis annua]
MLARQAWRFINLENNLMVKIFKAKYFPKNSFLEATLDSNPSYVWQSIFEAQEVMIKGVRVKIGNGQKTRVWGSPWLNDDIRGLISSIMPNELSNTVVSNLMEVDGSKDESLVRDVFDTVDVEKILNKPICNSDIDDGWRWQFDPKGKFTVKSCYRAVCGEFMGHQNQWRIQKLFPARLLSSSASYSHQPQPWLKSGLLAKMMVMDEKMLIAMVCWSLWLNKNNIVWKKVAGSVDSIIASAVNQFSPWNVSHMHDEDLRLVELLKEYGHVTWLPPREGWLKVNCDAACFSNNHETGLGMVVRDYMGNVVQARHVRVRGNVSPRMAEPMSIREALSWLKGFSHVIFSFVRRSANQATYIPAQNACSISGHYEWFCYFPEFLTNIIALEF